MASDSSFDTSWESSVPRSNRFAAAAANLLRGQPPQAQHLPRIVTTKSSTFRWEHYRQLQGAVSQRCECLRTQALVRITAISSSTKLTRLHSRVPAVLEAAAHEK